ncbi:MAG: hypothetical protein ACR2IQ_02660 [Minisyncoccia bacterium]
MDNSHEPVTKEMWYQANVNMKDTIKEFGNDIKDLRTDVRTISDTLGKVLVQTTTTNGRVNKLDDWSIEAKTLMEAHSTQLSENKTQFSRIWGGVAVLMVVGGAIITLSIMAINNKIKEGIHDALSTYNIEVK